MAIAIDSKIDSLFHRPKDDQRKLAAELHLKPVVLERLLRTLHFVSLFVAGFSYPGQDVPWINDQDAILANDEQGESVAAKLRHYGVGSR